MLIKAKRALKFTQLNFVNGRKQLKAVVRKNFVCLWTGNEQVSLVVVVMGEGTVLNGAFLRIWFPSLNGAPEGNEWSPLQLLLASLVI